MLAMELMGSNVCVGCGGGGVQGSCEIFVWLGLKIVWDLEVLRYGICFGSGGDWVERTVHNDTQS